MRILILLFMIIYLTACSNSNLKKKTQNQEIENTTFEKIEKLPKGIEKRGFKLFTHYNKSRKIISRKVYGIIKLNPSKTKLLFADGIIDRKKTIPNVQYNLWVYDRKKQQKLPIFSSQEQAYGWKWLNNRHIAAYYDNKIRVWEIKEKEITLKNIKSLTPLLRKIAKQKTNYFSSAIQTSVFLKNLEKNLQYPSSKTPKITAEISKKAKEFIKILTKDNIHSWIWKLEEKSKGIQYEVCKILFKNWMKHFGSRSSNKTTKDIAIEEFMSDPYDVPDYLLDIYIKLKINMGRPGFFRIWPLSYRAIPFLLKLRSSNKVKFIQSKVHYIIWEMVKNHALSLGEDIRELFNAGVIKLKKKAHEKEKLYYSGILFVSAGKIEELSVLRKALESDIEEEKAFAMSSILGALIQVMGWNSNKVKETTRSNMNALITDVKKWIDTHKSNLYFDEYLLQYKLKQ